MEQKKHFGFNKIKLLEKQKKVNKIFNSVSDKYDLMNNIMSLGLHHFWKKKFIKHIKIKNNTKILDVASGTGDIAYEWIKKLNSVSSIILTDINTNMLKIAQKKIINKGFIKNIQYIQANVEDLPFVKNTFDYISLGFGLRNFADKTKSLKSILRVLKPGGQLLILEFSHPMLLKTLYHKYLFNIIPYIGKCIVKDKKSYLYLAESIYLHPNQNELKNIILDAGFNKVDYYNLTYGIVCVHVCTKY